MICVQTAGPVPTAIDWYNPQGQLVSRNTGDEVNQAGAGSTATFLNFQSYRQSQGGRYECRVTGPGNNSEKLSVCIGECYTVPWVAVDYCSDCFIGLPDVHIVQALLNMTGMVPLLAAECNA